MTLLKGLIGSSAIALLLFVCESEAMAQSTTTVPIQGNTGGNYFLIPKGGWTLGAGQAGLTVEYTYREIVGATMGQLSASRPLAP